MKDRLLLSEADHRLLWSILGRRNRPLLEKLGREAIVTPAIRDSLLEAVGSELADSGFDANDEPNELGLTLERLINKLTKL